MLAVRFRDRVRHAEAALKWALRRAVAGLFALSCVGGCATTPTGRALPLDLLNRDGVTKDAVIAAFGDPDALYEQGRVLAYRLQGDKGRYGRVPRATNRIGWEGVDYDLVLAFSGSDVLERHSLVPIRAR